LNHDQLASVNPEAAGKTLDEQVGDVVKRPTVPDDLARFSLSDAVVGVIGVVANVATTISIGFRIAADFSEGQPAGIVTLVNTLRISRRAAC
jgi:hypothetical protein